jgi:hypothetical protein
LKGKKRSVRQMGKKNASDMFFKTERSWNKWIYSGQWFFWGRRPLVPLLLLGPYKCNGL